MYDKLDERTDPLNFSNAAMSMWSVFIPACALLLNSVEGSAMSFSWRAALFVIPLAAFCYWLLCPVPAWPTDPADQVRGLCILVTGASQGIGKSLVAEFAARGAAHIVIASRNRDKLEAVRASVLAQYPGVQITIVRADLSSANASAALVRETLAATGGQLDVLLLNHITDSRYGSWMSHRDTELGHGFLSEMFNVNTLSYIWLTTAAWPALLQSPHRGRIGVVSSLAAHAGTPRTAAYSASKHALEGVVQTMALHMSILSTHPPLSHSLCLFPTNLESGFFDSFRNELAIEGKRETPSITTCAIGATDTEGAASVKSQLSSAIVTFDPPEWAATAIVRGVAARRRTIYHPHHVVFPAFVLSKLWPELFDMILVASAV